MLRLDSRLEPQASDSGWRKFKSMSVFESTLSKKAVAQAMQQASPAYDKERAERAWAAAVQVAGSYAARFK